MALKSVLRGLRGTSGKKEPVKNTEYMLQGTGPFLTRDTDQSTRILAQQEIRNIVSYVGLDLFQEQKTYICCLPTE